MLRADVSDASMSLKSLNSLRRDAQVVCVDEAASVGVYGLVVGVNHARATSFRLRAR